MEAFSMLVAVALVLALTLFSGWVLHRTAAQMQLASAPLVDRINSLLPQTQCGRCGHPGCKPYAAFIAEGGAINRCPPGGAATIATLATLLGVERLPLDPTHGHESARTVAYIREAECIGCTKCIQACPVDAIVGSAKHMHTVIISECTGCDLCVDPCPVDCIAMVPAVPVAATAVEIKSAQPPAPMPLACIGCGFCNEVCPVQLQPQQLYRQLRARDYAKASTLDLQDCTECGDCDRACPSLIPLVQHFRAGKQAWLPIAEQRALGTQWLPRFVAHQSRLTETEATAALQRQARAALANQPGPAPGSTPAHDAIAAALLRVQAKKARGTPPSQEPTV